MSEENETPSASEGMKRSPLADLSGKQRKDLRGQAHHLSPVLRVGHEGVSQGVIEATSVALEDHELIKVKLLESAPEGVKDVAAKLALACGAHVAGTVGRVIVLYRRHRSRPQVRLAPR